MPHATEPCVLVLTRDDTSRDALNRLFNSQGLGVGFAADWGEALTQIHSRPPHLLLLDRALLETGSSLLKDLKQHFPEIATVVTLLADDAETEAHVLRIASDVLGGRSGRFVRLT